MLKVWRRVRRAKKIGLLNFFLLLIIMIILGFSFLFIHEESYSSKDHLFLTPKYYALKTPPLAVKRGENSEVLKVLDLFSLSEIEVMIKNKIFALDSHHPCLSLFASLGEKKWVQNLKFHFRLLEPNCATSGKLNLQGSFLFWPSSEQEKMSLYLSVQASEASLENCKLSSVLKLETGPKSILLGDFSSSYKENDALALMNLATIEIESISCSE